MSAMTITRTACQTLVASRSPASCGVPSTKSLTAIQPMSSPPVSFT